MDLFTKYNYIFNFLTQYFYYLNEPETLEAYDSDTESESDYNSEDYITD